MKIVQVMLIVEDTDLEEKIINLEERCNRLNISLQDIFQTTSATMPNKPYVDILVNLSDLKISDIEETERMKHLFSRFKIHKKDKGEKGYNPTHKKSQNPFEM